MIFPPATIRCGQGEYQEYMIPSRSISLPRSVMRSCPHSYMWALGAAPHDAVVCTVASDSVTGETVWKTFHQETVDTLEDVPGTVVRAVLFNYYSYSPEESGFRR